MLAAGITVVEILADIGIGSLVFQTINGVIKPTSINLAHRLCLYLAEGVIIGMVCDKCNDSFEKEIDELVELYKMARGEEVA